jgi:hypothetical protein
LRPQNKGRITNERRSQIRKTACEINKEHNKQKKSKKFNIKKQQEEEEEDSIK